MIGHGTSRSETPVEERLAAAVEADAYWAQELTAISFAEGRRLNEFRWLHRGAINTPPTRFELTLGARGDVIKLVQHREHDIWHEGHIVGVRTTPQEMHERNNAARCPHRRECDWAVTREPKNARMCLSCPCHYKKFANQKARA